MNKPKSLIYRYAFTVIFLLGIVAQQAFARQTEYTKYVDPFVGNADNGHTFPGACRPFGMIQTSPVTGGIGWRYCSNMFIATL